MPRSEKLYLHDILNAITRIEGHIIGVDKDTFISNALLMDSVLYNLVMLGEAVKNISDKRRDRYPDVRWREIGRFRDRLVHHYFGLDYDLIWEIVDDHLTPLKIAVEHLLETIEDEKE